MLNKYFIWFFFLFLLSLGFFYMGLMFLLINYFCLYEYKLIFINSLTFYYVLIVDWKCFVFISVVLFISCMVILYSSFYMGYMSSSSNRFLYLVLMFILSMFLMILSPNLISILLGWDGLGLVSYCLVIYYSSMNSNLSGLITCLINRLGDIGILISISWIMSFGGWNFIFYNYFYDMNIFYLIILSSFTSSAQSPFSCWLPAAMAAPTPVSALVHSSTLVTAGVYLLIRFFSNLLVYNFFFVLIGIFTMIFSSLCANFEFDLKSIIAFSTLSQLGLMVMSLFMGLIDYSFFHLLTHAMFKSLLFLCSGIYIFYYLDNQDIRFMGGCCKFLPISTCCFNVSSMALCGIPFLSGFYSKDLIVEMSFFSGCNYFLMIMFYLSLGLTCCYSFRLMYYSLMSSFSFMSLNCFSSEFNFMGMVVFMMTMFSIFFGCMLNWLINLDLYFITLPLDIKLMSFCLVVLGIWLGIEFNYLNYLFNYHFYHFNSNMWFMFGYSTFLVNLGLSFCYNYFKVLYWGEFFLTNKLFNYMLNFSYWFQIYLNNSLSIFMISYLFWFIYMF
uniref:NADH-ubiquinone oxidoreductase chain 5 n=1 Tax=Leptocentrus albolineatus TaxID=2605028 RepID=A0A5B9T593_9HEMI|nr:NADH dehydrogenase subunit 5 [Leptocentrus albolineatus]QEG98453.1 NADH dehydrogenase subunit 5 [Leptocentrus albolineatus]